MPKIHIGISTCPNDTFAFHALMAGKVDTHGIDFQFELLDVQQLNQRLIEGDFDVAKASFHAALLLSDVVGVLDSGSALGFGVGPLLLSAKENRLPNDLFFENDNAVKQRPARILCPGEHTTANLLYRLFYPQQGEIENIVFSEIMPCLQTGTADFGVCIHEGRFTYREAGLDCVADLGQLWEAETNAPLPLGGIVARQELGEDLHRKVSAVIRASVVYGLQDRKQHGAKTETLLTMRKYAQELSDAVLLSHVDLYVNDWTISIRGNETKNRAGQTSLDLLWGKARLTGVIAGHQPQLKIL